MLVNPKLRLRESDVTWSTRPPNKSSLIFRRINGWFWAKWRKLFKSRPKLKPTTTGFVRKHFSFCDKELQKREKFFQDVLDNLEKSTTIKEEILKDKRRISSV